jgi:D-3-phosphoglycerate dehydrogenase
MLYLTNEDQPGVIGGLGQVLAKNKVNISRMQLGRVRAGGRAIAVVGIDTTVSSEVLSALRSVPHVLSVKQVKL